MPSFTIEKTFHIPVYKHRTYTAGSIEEACTLALQDEDWLEARTDYEAAGETYITGAWPGDDTAYRASPIPIPSQFGEAIQRKAGHFETLLGVLKIPALGSKRTMNADGKKVAFATFHAFSI